MSKYSNVLKNAKLSQYLQYIHVGRLRKRTVYIITPVVHVFGRSHVTAAEPVLTTRYTNPNRVVVWEAGCCAVTDAPYTHDVGRFGGFLVRVCVFSIAYIS